MERQRPHGDLTERHVHELFDINPELIDTLLDPFDIFLEMFGVCPLCGSLLYEIINVVKSRFEQPVNTTKI